MLLRIDKSKHGHTEWYFQTYVYQCERCGKEFTKSKPDKRSLYCSECKAFDDRQKAKEKAKKQTEANERKLRSIEKKYQKALWSLSELMGDKGIYISLGYEDLYFPSFEELRKWIENE